MFVMMSTQSHRSAKPRGREVPSYPASRALDGSQRGGLRRWEGRCATSEQDPGHWAGRLQTPRRIHMKQREEGGNLPLLPVCMQSTPNRVFFSLTCRDLIEAKVSIGDKPLFWARAMGTQSSASAKARIAYCSSPGLCVMTCQYDTAHSGKHHNQCFWCTYLDGGLLDGQRACNFCCTSAIDDAIVADEISNHAERIM